MKQTLVSVVIPEGRTLQLSELIQYGGCPGRRRGCLCREMAGRQEHYCQHDITGDVFQGPTFTWGLTLDRYPGRPQRRLIACSIKGSPAIATPSTPRIATCDRRRYGICPADFRIA